MIERILVTAREAAALLAVSIDTVYESAARGDLPCVRIGSGRNIRFSVEALRSWAVSNQSSSPPSPSKELACER